MMTNVRQFTFQRGEELLEILSSYTQNSAIGYWHIQLDTLRQHQKEHSWYLGVVDGQFYASNASSWNAVNLSKALHRFIPKSQQSDLKPYLTQIHQSGLIHDLSPCALLSRILLNGWVQKWQLEAALRMKILVDMDTYLTLGSGYAQFIEDDSLSEALPIGGFPVKELITSSKERQANWQRFKSYLPSMNLIPILNPEKLAHANLNINQREWLEQQTQRKLPLSHIAAGLGQDPIEIAKVFSQLVHAGIVRLVRPEQNSPPTIMVIDDSPLVLRQFQQWLGALGYSALLCQHAQQAINTIRQANPSLIFLDINMPQISGFDLVKQLRMVPELAKIPVVILTAEQKLSNKWRAQWSNCEFLTKPLSSEEIQTFPEELRTLIQTQLSGGETS
jgi:CheY-like chemotaxis protein